MMVQSAPEGEPRFITMMREHNAFCGELIRAFGNDAFEACEPHDEVVYVVSHHDYGWDETDAHPTLAPNGYPRGLGNGPVPGIIGTGPQSVEVNSRRHLYCGLISSMHIWGLYNERYGLSQFEVRIGGSKSVPVAEADRAEADAMLAAELARQGEIKRTLAADPAAAKWLDEDHVLQNYKQLQFIDTLALYFHLRHASERRPETFVHVPKSRTEDAQVTLTPKGGGVYQLDPFPFRGDELKVACRGRYFGPVKENLSSQDLADALRRSQATEQTHILVRG
ncbi:MAG: DUF3891 family protein [Hyphomicrobiales bacterium]